jgi:hypothetical protein
VAAGKGRLVAAGWVWRGATVLAAAAGLCGCAGGKGQRGAATGSEPVPSAGLNALAAEPHPAAMPGQEDVGTLAAQSAASLDRLFKTQAGEPEPSGPGPEAAGPPIVHAPPEVEPTGPVAAARVHPEPAPVVAAPLEPPKPLDQRVGEAATALVDLLRQQAMDGPESSRAHLALAAMELLKPGAMQQVISPQAIGSPLNGPDAEALEALGRFMASLGAADGRSIAARVRELSMGLSSFGSLAITSAQLCSKVMGYGQYEVLGTGKFLHGKPIHAVIYVELANFGHRELTASERAAAWSPGDPVQARWAVDLVEEVQVYTGADGTLVWSKSPEGIVETSRNRRRDFYLVDRVTLPLSLNVGSYTLKVRVRDRVSGTSDEANLPFEIVADPRLIQASARGE